MSNGFCPSAQVCAVIGPLGYMSSTIAPKLLTEDASSQSHRPAGVACRKTGRRGIRRDRRSGTNVRCRSSAATGSSSRCRSARVCSCRAWSRPNSRAAGPGIRAFHRHCRCQRRRNATRPARGNSSRKYFNLGRSFLSVTKHRMSSGRIESVRSATDRRDRPFRHARTRYFLRSRRSAYRCTTFIHGLSAQSRSSASAADTRSK
jgi:hypothetical protein